VRVGAVEQQDAADEAGASHGASLLILVSSRPQAIELRRETATVTDFTRQAGASPSPGACRVDCPRE